MPADKIAEFCRRHRIRKLALFGSVLRDDFNEDRDMDVLVGFEPEVAVGLNFYSIERELSLLLGRNVDLIRRISWDNSFGTKFSTRRRCSMSRHDDQPRLRHTIA
jgi:predicted nucleotidyltransferase